MVTMTQNLVQEIDQTLDQLIRNAEAISEVELKELSEPELEGFQKTQESLIQHLFHVDELLATKQKAAKIPQFRTASTQIQAKKQRFETLHTEFKQELQKVEKIPIICKRKCKKVLLK